jgi:multiple sugar transport system permease protein
MKPLVDVQSDFHWLPSRFTLRPFVEIWHTVPLGHYFVNSAIVSLAAMAFSVAVAVFAAYAVSRYRFAGRQVF